MKPDDKARQEKVIEQFPRQLFLMEGKKVEIIERQDLDPRGGGGCEAIIECEGKRIALEHTTIESFIDQRVDDIRFGEVIVPLERALSKYFPDSFIRIGVQIRSVKKEIDWEVLRDSLIAGCKNILKTLPCGNKIAKKTLAGVPFPVHLTRFKAKALPGCYVYRWLESSHKREMAKIIARAFKKKRNQLIGYKAEGKPIVLILDSDDFVLNDAVSIAEAFVEATRIESVEPFDKIFLALTSNQPVWFLPLKLGNRCYPGIGEFQRYLEWNVFHGQ